MTTAFAQVVAGEKVVTSMDIQLMWILAALGTLALIGVFVKMTKGFGPFNLRVIGIVLIATFASLLGLREGGSLTAAMGILGAIAGYLFGLKDSTPQQ